MGILNNLFSRRGRSSQPLPRRGSRNYSGGSQDRLTADWFSSDLSTNDAFLNRGQTVRNRARDLERNNPYVRRFLQMVSANVYGHQGIRLAMDTRDTRSGGVQEPDVAANRTIEAARKRRGRAGNCTADGRTSWRETERMILRRVLVDGEALVKLNRGGDGFGLSLQLLDVDLLDDKKKNEPNVNNQNRIVSGVEMDKNDRPVAYHLVVDKGAEFDRKTERVPAEEMLHVYIPERPGQVRGISWLASTMWRQKMLDAWTEAALVHSRVAASKLGFLIPSEETYTGAGQAAEGYTKMSSEPGSFEELPAGMKVETFDASPGPTTMGEFSKHCLRGIASGLGASYVTIANDLEGVSYSSIRQGELADRDNWRVLQQFAIEHVSEPVMDEWLLMALTSGEIPLPLNKIDKWRSYRFEPRGWEWIDPQKEINAAREAVALRVKSRRKIISDMGGNVENTFADLAADQSLAEEMGLINDDPAAADLGTEEDE